MGSLQAPVPSTYGWTTRAPCASSSTRPTRRSVRLVKCQAEPPKSENPFTYRRELSGAQKFLAGLPSAGAYVLALALVAAGGATGAVAGSRLPENTRKAGQAGGAVLLGAASAVGASKVIQERQGAAGVVLNNLLVDAEDIGSLGPDDFVAINQRYGVKLAEKLTDEVKGIYGQYIESQIPIGETPLSGFEPERISKFRDALGLSDEDAAAVHIDVGRRFSRQRQEAAKQADKSAQLKAFQKLIYVSTIVFGEQRAAFLLPWRRVFSLTDAQLSVAKRDNAKALFNNHIQSLGGELQADLSQLKALRAFQTRVRLADEIAAEAVREAARTRVERGFERAIATLKQRTRARDVNPLLEEVWSALDYSRRLGGLASEPDVVPGLGKVAIYGSALEKRTVDLKEVFRTYVGERLRLDGRFSDELQRDCEELQAMMTLGPQEARNIVSELTSSQYKDLLREAVSSKQIDQVTSPAAFLQDLCDRLRFDGEAAQALHKQIFQTRIQNFLEDKKISDAEEEELGLWKKRLCIPTADIESIRKDTCGNIFRTVVEDALAAGIDRFSFTDRDNVKGAIKDLRLGNALAKEILDTCARKTFQGFITRSRSQSNRLESAKELKRLVYYSNIVVAPLLDDIKGGEGSKEASKDAAMQELSKLMVEAKARSDQEGGEASASEEADAKKEVADLEQQIEKAAAAEPVTAESANSQSDSTEAQVAGDVADSRPASLKKSQDAAAARSKGEEIGDTGKYMKSQKEINLGKDLDMRDRKDTYRNFLMFCVSGDVVQLPMGSTVVVERDQSEFARLSQLGDILGLTPLDVSSVHTDMAEQAYRQQVQSVIGDGNVTKERIEQLEEMREKLGLGKEAADKIVNGVRNQRLIGDLNAAKASGSLNLQRLLDMQESGVDINSFTSSEMRLNMYSKEVQQNLSDGTGEFDEQHMLKKLPQQLGLNERQVKQAIEGLAASRKQTVLVQGIANLRARKLPEVIRDLNNLLACNKALPSEQSMQWREKEELLDLYGAYLTSKSGSEKEEAVRTLLGISEPDAKSLADLVASGNFNLAQEAEKKEVSFF
ncbi:hypothetical protein WJX74_002584 [Apatococcus lobatus]|uniref:Uncharacterized protein n=1 Tax=Apatococcus lobatus TaxID=904363 RepID=A0AAW1RCZ8_9CHLO